MFPKQKPWRSEPYLKWIRSLPCMFCAQPSEPHHLIGVGHMSGMWMKAPDWATIPLCRRCHDKMHDDSDLHPDQWRLITKTLGAAIDAGKLQWRK